MHLVGYQAKYLDELYHAIVHDDERIICFTGPKGCGKSTIMNELSDSLIENWKVFLVTGTGVESPPYYTWYSTTHKSPVQTRKRITEVSFGVNFQPIGLPVGFELNLGMGADQLFLNSNEQAILKAINREVMEKENILIIAEDYNSWDHASKEMLNKLSHANSDVFFGANKLYTVLVDTNLNHSASKANCKSIKISANDIELSDIDAIISSHPQIKTLEPYDLNSIIRFTGYDLRLINLAVHYIQEGFKPSQIHSLSELLEIRIQNMPEKGKDVCRTLEHVSIINSLFSEKEAAYLQNQQPDSTEKTLDEAVNHHFIRKRHAYDFPNPEIQQYFANRLDSEKKYLHYRFARYLQERYPEDYLNRAYHLCLSEQAVDDKNIVEAVYMIVIEIIRRQELTGGAAECMLEERLSNTLDFLPDAVLPFIKDNIQAFMNGYHLLNQCKYAESIMQFNNLRFMYASKAFSVESSRLLLLCHVQLADDLQEMKKLSDSLYDNIMESEFCEDELWCRAALLLLEVYGDRHVQPEKFNQLKSGLETRLRKHMYQSAFRTLEAKYGLKAALFYNSMVSVELTEKSCEYYRTYHSIPNLYFSLCNNAANRIVCGDYIQAQARLQECKHLISENPGLHFPSTYKIENNMVINNFLQTERHENERERVICAAAAASERLAQLRHMQGDEVSHVIQFNYWSMLMLAGERDQSKAILQQFKAEYKHLDAYYRYFYHNAMIAQHMLDGRFDDATKNLEQLENLEVVLLAGFSKILNRRNQFMHQLIQERYTTDAYSLNYIFLSRGMRVQDPSYYHWARVYLLSDLQFLSR